MTRLGWLFETVPSGEGDEAQMVTVAVCISWRRLASEFLASIIGLVTAWGSC